MNRDIEKLNYILNTLEKYPMSYKKLYPSGVPSSILKDTSYKHARIATKEDPKLDISITISAGTMLSIAIPYLFGGPIKIEDIIEQCIKGDTSNLFSATSFFVLITSDYNYLNLVLKDIEHYCRVYDIYQKTDHLSSADQTIKVLEYYIEHEIGGVAEITDYKQRLKDFIATLKIHNNRDLTDDEWGEIL